MTGAALPPDQARPRGRGLVITGSILVGLYLQRGPVKGAVGAWVLAIGGMPAIGGILAAAISLVSAGQDSLGSVALAGLLVGIPLLTALALVSGAWLTWGKPRTS
jgi:hypothetical protein